MRNHYFVVVPEPIVAQDLAHAIRAFDPAAKISLFPSATEAMPALRKARPTAMFLHLDETDFAWKEIIGYLRDKSLPVVFTGPEAQMQTSADDILGSPFSEASVALLLRDLRHLRGDRDKG